MLRRDSKDRLGLRTNDELKLFSAKRSLSPCLWEFVVPLVKAVQEQQAIIDQQQKQIAELLKRVQALEKK